VRLDGWGVLVTGGASGIGAETVRRFVGQGAAVAILDNSLNAALEVAEDAGAGGARVVAYEVDVTDPASVHRTVSLARATFGRLDCLVNCAGIREITPVLDLEPEDWSRVISVNLTGTFLASQAFARAVVLDGNSGSIVNVASTAGLLGLPRRAAYVASKHGVVGLTKQMAVELGAHRIRVNAVAPGVVRTPMTEAYFADDETARRVDESHPLGRHGEPGEIADAIFFLASPSSSFTTGAVLSVDGGFTAGRRF